MGLPEQWFADPEIFDRVNARGSETVVRAAARAGARRVVHTSTIDVFHAERGSVFDESQVADYPKGTAYERSKQRAEELALAAAAETGIELVIVNPPASTGTGRAATRPRSSDALLRPVIEGGRAAVPLLPPGGMGLVAHDRRWRPASCWRPSAGVPGERYILCDGHMSFRELARDRGRLAGRGQVPPVMPVPVAKALAGRRRGLSRLVRRPPLLPRGSSILPLGRAAAVGEGAARAGLGRRRRSRRASRRRWPRSAEVRRAEPADFPAVARLLHQQRRRHVRPLRRGPRASPGACSSARCARPGNASSADVVWVAELDGRVAGAMAAFPVSEAVGALARVPARSRCARAAHGAGRRRYLYWAGGRASPTPPAEALLRRRARHRPALRAPRRRHGRCSPRRSARRGRAACRPSRSTPRVDNAAARALYAARATGRWPIAPAGRGLPGFVALVKPLR